MEQDLQRRVLKIANRLRSDSMQEESGFSVIKCLEKMKMKEYLQIVLEERKRTSYQNADVNQSKSKEDIDKHD